MKHVMAFVNGFLDTFMGGLKDLDAMWNNYIAYIDKKYPSKK